MTKKDLAKKIADGMNVNQLLALEIVQKTFDGITEALVNDGRIELRNFGVFEVKERRPRSARNPRTGEKVMVPQRRVVTFKPGREMEQRVAQTRSGRQRQAEADRTAQPSPRGQPVLSRPPEGKPKGTETGAPYEVPSTQP